MANTTQGLAIALFGAYAGGYTAQLDADIAKSGLGPVAESLLGLQGPLLGLDLSDNATWIDVTLGNLGVNSTSAAYNGAKAWFEGALPVLGRGGAVAAAIEYLLGTSVDAAYTSVATAFAANVAKAATYSATTAGAAELDVATLQGADGVAGAPGGFNLTAALATLKAANTAVSDHIDAWGLKQTPVIAAADSDAGDIYAKVAAAEAAVETKSAAAALGISAGTQAALDDVAEAAAYDTYSSKDTAENLALTIAQAEISTKKLALDGALTAAVTALEAVSTTDATGSLQALVDTWIAKAAAATAAATAETAAGVVTQSKEAAADVALDAAFDSATVPVDYSFAVTASAGSVNFDASNVGGTAFGDYLATYNATTDAWSYFKDASVTALSAAAAAADTNLQKLLANADAKAVLDAAAAEAEAAAATTAANTAKATALAAVEAVHVDLTDGTDLTGAADAYRDAKDALTAYNTAKTAFDTAVTAQTAARAEGAELAALEKAAATAKTAITTEGWDINNAAAGANTKDLYVFAKANIVTDTFTSNDLVFMGTAYTLSNLPTGKVPGTDVIGSTSALEMFWDVANEKLYVEKAAYSGDAAGADNFYTVVLTGVAADAALTYNNGYIALA